MGKFFIIAGEVSGDMFAASLMKSMNRFQPCRFFGFGGVHMRKLGLEPLFDDNTLMSVVGLFEAWRFVLRQLKMLRSIVPFIKKNNISHVILVDHEMFSLLAAKRIRRAFGSSVKIYFFIAPRVSMWGRKVAPMAASLCDVLFCYMQNDVAIYRQYGGNALYFGNPLSQALKTFVNNPDFFIKHNLNPNKEYIAIMPGSRRQEIKTLLPVFLFAANRFHKETGAEYLMAVAHKGLRPYIEKEISSLQMEDIVHILDDSSLELMSHCRFGLLSAGTVTLEAVMMGVFPIIAYKVTSMTFKIIKKSENLDDDTLVGLPNVFLGQRFFPELLQWEVTSERIYQELEAVYKMSPALYEYTMKIAKDRLSHALGDINSIEKVAEYIIDDSAGRIWQGS